MGLRFRRSVKIAPGVKINLNKKSVSATIGTKGVHVTKNSNGRKTTTVNLPVKGLYYTTTSTTAKNRHAKTSNAPIEKAAPVSAKQYTSNPAPSKPENPSPGAPEKVKYKFTVNVSDIPNLFDVCVGCALLIAAFFVSGFSVFFSICLALLGLMCIGLYIKYKCSPGTGNYITPEQLTRWQALVGENAPKTVYELKKASLPLLIALKDNVDKNTASAVSSENQSGFQEYSAKALDGQKKLVAFSEFITFKNESPEAELRQMEADFKKISSTKTD